MLDKLSINILTYLANITKNLSNSNLFVGVGISPVASKCHVLFWRPQIIRKFSQKFDTLLYELYFGFIELGIVFGAVLQLDHQNRIQHRLIIHFF